MTPTTGADMTDQKTQMREGFEAQRKAGMNVDWFTWQIAWHDALFTVHDLVGDETGRQPAAIDKQCTCKGVLGHSRQCAMFDESMMSIATPLANEASKPADNCKPGGCSAIGCDGGHYCFNKDGAPKPASPSVEQDERGAILRDLMQLASEAFDHTAASFTSRVIALANRARAASTSANVAQTVSEKCARLAEVYRDEHAMSGQEEEICNAIAEACRDYGSTNVAQGAEAQSVYQYAQPGSPEFDGAEAYQQHLEAQSGDQGFVFPPLPPAVVLHDKVGPLFDRLSMQFYADKCMRNAAPPAQTALTDDARDAARYRWLKAWGKTDGWPDEAIDREAAIDAALTAAQSASGDTNG